MEMLARHMTCDRPIVCGGMKSAPPLKSYELINLIAGDGVLNQLHVTVDQVFNYLTVNKVIGEPHVVSY